MDIYKDIVDLHYDEKEEHLRWDLSNKAKERSSKSCFQKQRRKSPRVQQMTLPDLFT